MAIRIRMANWFRYIKITLWYLRFSLVFWLKCKYDWFAAAIVWTVQKFRIIEDGKRRCWLFFIFLHLLNTVAGDGAHTKYTKLSTERGLRSKSRKITWSMVVAATNKRCGIKNINRIADKYRQIAGVVIFDVIRRIDCIVFSIPYRCKKTPILRATCWIFLYIHYPIFH